MGMSGESVERGGESVERGGYKYPPPLRARERSRVWREMV